MARRWSRCVVAVVAILCVENVRAYPQEKRNSDQGAATGFLGRGGLAPHPAGGNHLKLLANEEVQSELGLSGAQADEIASIRREYSDQRQEVIKELRSTEPTGKKFVDRTKEENAKYFKWLAALDAKACKLHSEAVVKAEKLLRPEQLTRLRQISWQILGAGALEDEIVRKELAITQLQLAQMEAIHVEATTHIKEAYRNMPDAKDDEAKAKQRAERDRKTAEIFRETDEKLLGVLTEDQRGKFAEMKGDEFKAPEELR